MSDDASSPPPRLSETPFPPYRFMPGKAPHPFAHEGGWGYGLERPVPPYHPPDQWQQSDNYLYGCDLFNAGWWWEAHETWEEQWHVTQAHSPGWTDLLKGLIQLAACALNRERGVHGGANRLLVTACEALQRAESADEGDFGLDLSDLRARAHTHLAAEAPSVPGFYLRPTSER